MARIIRSGRGSEVASLRWEGGFTYVLLLAAISIAAIGAAAAAVAYETTGKQARERELIYAGSEFMRAIGSYYQMQPAGTKRYPASLQDLLIDNRFPTTVRHLRKVYRDPMTGHSKWGTVDAPGGGIMGLYSLSDGKPMLDFRTVFPGQSTQISEKYSDWKFVYLPDARK